MHDPSVTAAARLARQGSAADLADALQQSRQDTLSTFAAFERALPDLRVPQRPELNPPLWELGHIGWFQDWWLQRFAARSQGWRADPELPRGPALQGDADSLYNSSEVPHGRRWRLCLPDATQTRAQLAQQLRATLALLSESRGATAGGDDAALYFFRLVLLHEDMHHEASLYTAQSLDVPIDPARWQPPNLPEPPSPLHFGAAPWRLGSEADAGFAFDNELGAHTVELEAVQIDTQVLRWADYLPFVEAGGYRQHRQASAGPTPPPLRWWTEAGHQWRLAQQLQAPRYLRADAAGWLQWRHGKWQRLDLSQPACHLSQHEALAWCAWAGRRLPTEAEWERAALSQPDAFRWGDVWEWTASAFSPYPGFVPHPYRDYSAPWFDGRPVLRGGSFMTQPRIKHPRYRNFFAAQRNDIAAGFRRCAL